MDNTQIRCIVLFIVTLQSLQSASNHRNRKASREIVILRYLDFSSMFYPQGVLRRQNFI